MEQPYHETKEAIQKRYKIWEFLHLTLQIDDRIKISDICSNNTKQYFVETVKMFIVADLGRLWGFYIEFGSDYETIVKREYWD